MVYLNIIDTFSLYFSPLTKINTFATLRATWLNSTKASLSKRTLFQWYFSYIFYFLNISPKDNFRNGGGKCISNLRAKLSYDLLTLYHIITSKITWNSFQKTKYELLYLKTVLRNTIQALSLTWRRYSNIRALCSECTMIQQKYTRRNLNRS